jgi:prepilin-type N-terminal cleavage/methylation domain-containing protein
MRSTMKSILTDKRGYTLVELMVNLGIIAILAAISVPTYLTYREKAKIGRARAELKNIHLAVEALAADTEKWPGPTLLARRPIRRSGISPHPPLA